MNAAAPSRLVDKALAPRFALLCLGVWLNAADTLVTATIMPSVAREIGGYQYFGWSVAAYLTGSIVAGACSGKLSTGLGLRAATALTGLIYAVGCAMSALAPEFVTFILGRLIQGLGAGAVVALCYVAITALFPERLWPRVYGAVAGVWGAATLLGPLLGGLFAAAGFWRGAFWLFVVQAVIFVGAVLVMLPADKGDTGRGRIPTLQLALLVVGVSLIGGAGVVASPGLAATLAVGGMVGMAAMLAVNARTHDRLLPRNAADLRTATGLGLLTIFATEAAVIGFTVYGPAFIQVRHHASPLTAGYVVGAIAAGWTLCAMVFGHTPAQKDGRLVRLGAGVILVGAALSAWATARGTLIETAAAFAVLGAGFGLAHAFVARRAIGAAPADEQAMASSAVPTSQLIGGAAGAAGAGALANVLGFSHGVDPTLAASHGLVLFGAFLPLAVVGFAAAWRLGR
ncbi:MFS transporter [Caulobacter sp. RL271]|jgi:MFS family permease|uniref:MFS transporter n=1 Tax=Caulobacter segnis TaxID=88688 RepID=A0ABY4ZVM3_9CAUL|nr:MFS transporter [Caulobacter segnis]USQ96679.1 MFS transporter [Caulobacter segnis]